MDTFAKRLIAIKDKKGLSLDNISQGVTRALKAQDANAQGITKSGIHRWTQGATEPQNRDMWNALADFLGEDVAWLQSGVRRRANTKARRLARKISELSDEHQAGLEAIIDGLHLRGETENRKNKTIL